MYYVQLMHKDNWQLASKKFLGVESHCFNQKVKTMAHGQAIFSNYYATLVAITIVAAIKKHR